MTGGLSKQGYEVHAAPHPHHALELVKAANPFSDVIMPDMSGPELVRNIRRICPCIAVVSMSAHIASEGLPEFAAFIGKPFRIDQLNAMVKKAIPGSDQADASNSLVDMWGLESLIAPTLHTINNTIRAVRTASTQGPNAKLLRTGGAFSSSAIASGFQTFVPTLLP